MNWLDVSLLVLVAISVISGIREGFSRSGFGLLALLVAFVAAAWVYPNNAKAFLVVFAVMIAAAAVAGCLLGKLLVRTGPKWVDQLLGGAFGAANAAVLSVVAVLALMAFGPKLPREYFEESQLAPYAVEAAHITAAIVPDEVKTRVEESYSELVRVAPPKLRRVMPPAEI